MSFIRELYLEYSRIRRYRMLHALNGGRGDRYNSSVIRTLNAIEDINDDHIKKLILDHLEKK